MTVNFRFKAMIAEDECVIQMLLEELLSEQNVDVVACVADITTAMTLTEAGGFDFAVLDVGIVGGRIDPVAAALRDRNIPVIFATGSSRQSVSQEFGDCIVIEKPFLAGDLARAVETVISRL